MKNKKGKWAAITVLGLFAFVAGRDLGDTFGNFVAIVGAILAIGGIVEFFKKQKITPPNA